MHERSIPSDGRLASLVLAGAWLLSSVPAFASTPAEILAGYRAAAGQAPLVAERGAQLFTSTHGHTWSCASCHGALPTGTGQHAGTGKTIAPLAPAFNPQRFTDATKTEKWFRRNCQDVLGRACSPGEKAEVMGWLLSLKP